MLLVVDTTEASAKVNTVQTIFSECGILIPRSVGFGGSVAWNLS